MAASSAAGTSNTKVWIPVDVKTHWFGFLGVPDLCNCLRVCKAWTSLITKTADAEIATITAATPPSLGRSGKLKFLHRLHYAHQSDNLGYLLSWAAGNREYTPFLHKLLLLRDCIREDLGLPGGLHEPARPEAYDELEESLRALWTYKYNTPISHGAGLQPTAPVEVVTLPPLVVAASRGNIDALSLLLLFGEGIHPRRKGNDKALYAAVEQGNVSCVAALLGRLELHPPRHPPHLAKRLGLVRPSWNVFGPGMVYSAGVSVGPQNVAATIAATKIRAELAAASGIATDQGTKALASATAARSRAAALQASVAAASITPIEAMVAQQEIFEHDGRYRHWCNGLHMGTYWFLYDSAISNYEAIHGPIGAEPLPKDAPPNARPGTAGTQDVRPAALMALPSPAARASFAARRMTISIFNLQDRLNARVACGSIGPLVSLKRRKESVTAGYAAQALLASRLPANGLLPLVSQPRRRGYIHPCLPEPVHYGRIASDAIALKIRVNIGPQEGRTPLLAACERGRVEIAYLLLSHVNIKQALTAEVPELPRRPQDEENHTPAHQNAAPQPGGAPQMVAAVAPPPPVVSAPSNPYRAALYAVASAKGSALAVASEVAMGHEARRQEVLLELLQEERDRSDVDLAPTGYHTPLCLACDRGDERLVALLLHWGADVNREGRKEARPLLVAIMAGHEHVVKLLLRTSTSFELAQAVAQALVEVLAPRGDASDSLVQLFPIAAGSTGERERGRTRTRARSRGAHQITSSDIASSPLTEDDEDAFRGDDGAEPSSSRGALEMLGLTGAVRARSTSRSHGGAQAAEAVGSIIASQTRKGGARRQLRRPEDPAIDCAEPTVVTALLVAAAANNPDDVASTAAQSVQGSATAFLPSGFNMGMYLPSDEMSMSSGSAFRFGIFNPSIRRQASGGAGMGRFANLKTPTAGATHTTELSDANVENMLLNGTGATYALLVEEMEGYRFAIRGEINKILSFSRVINGIGVVVGRPALDVNLGDESGYTPLFIAASTGRFDSVVLLLAAGADCSLQTKRGKTAIYGAVEKCHVDIVDHLLHKYTATQLRANTTYGTNVMHAANKAGNNRIKDMLNQYCVDWDMKDARRIRDANAAKRWADDPSRTLTVEEKNRKQDAYMKRMMGVPASEDDDVANPLESAQVVAQMEKLRRVAEATKRKQEEQDARRRDRDRVAEEDPSAGGGGGPRRARDGQTVQTSMTTFESAFGAPSAPSPRNGAANVRGRSELRSSADHRARSNTRSGRQGSSTTRAHTASNTAAQSARGSSLARTTVINSFRQPIDSKEADEDSDDGSAAPVAAPTTIVRTLVPSQSTASGDSTHPGLINHLRTITTVRQALPAAPRLTASPLTLPNDGSSPRGGFSHHESKEVEEPPKLSLSPLGSSTNVPAPVAQPAAPVAQPKQAEAAVRSVVTVTHTLGKPPKAAVAQAAAQSVPVAKPSAGASEGDGLSVFERLAAKAKEIDRKRAEQVAEAEAAARAASQIATKRDGYHGKISPPSARGSAPVRRTSSASSLTGKMSDSGKSEDDDSAFDRLPAAPARSRPTSSDLDTSFGLDKPQSTKYGGTSVAEIRATAREQVKPNEVVEAKKSTPSSTVSVSTGTGPSADDVRLKRAAFYEKLRKEAAADPRPQPSIASPKTRAPSELSMISTDDRPSLLSGTGLADYATRVAPPSSKEEVASNVAHIRRLVREKSQQSSPTKPTATVSAARPGVSIDVAGTANIRSPTEKLVSTSANEILRSTAPGLASILSRIQAWDMGSDQLQRNSPRAPEEQMPKQSRLLQKPVPQVHDRAGAASPDITMDFSPSGARRRAADYGAPISEPQSPSSEPAATQRARMFYDPRPPLKPREIFVEDSTARAHGFVGSSLATGRSKDAGAAAAAQEKRKPVSAKASFSSGVPAAPAAKPALELGVGGFAIGPGASNRVLAAGDASARASADETALRDQRIQMREIQRSLRQASRREEEDRRAREAMEVAASAAPQKGSLALAAAAYGAPLLKKPVKSARY